MLETCNVERRKSSDSLMCLGGREDISNVGNTELGTSEVLRQSDVFRRQRRYLECWKHGTWYVGSPQTVWCVSKTEISRMLATRNLERRKSSDSLMCLEDREDISNAGNTELETSEVFRQSDVFRRQRRYLECWKHGTWNVGSPQIVRRVSKTEKNAGNTELGTSEVLRRLCTKCEMAQSHGALLWTFRSAVS